MNHAALSWPAVKLPLEPDPQLPGAVDCDSVAKRQLTKAELPPADCVVCGDKASGKHYGQFSCEGCKSFFKRSVRRNLTYACRSSRTCPVDLQHRNQCQYCRFEKCIAVGMRREAVQRGRVATPGSVTLYHQQQQHYATGWSDCSQAASYSLANLLSLLVKAGQSGCQRPTIPGVGGVGVVGDIGGDALASDSLRVLSAAVDWARGAPFYSELSHADQLTLLRSSWWQLFALTSFQFSLGHAMYVQQQQQQQQQQQHQALPDAATRSLLLSMERLKAMGADLAEYCCLKALALFNPDCAELQDGGCVEAAQCKVQWVLEEYCRVHHGAQADRCGRLLLRLQSLASVGSRVTEQRLAASVGCAKGAPADIDRLLRELLLGSGSVHCAVGHQQQLPQYTYGFHANGM